MVRFGLDLKVSNEEATSVVGIGSVVYAEYQQIRAAFPDRAHYRLL